MLKIYQLKLHHNIDNVDIAYANNFHGIDDLVYTINNVHELVVYNLNKYMHYHWLNTVVENHNGDLLLVPFSTVVAAVVDQKQPAVVQL